MSVFFQILLSLTHRILRLRRFVLISLSDVKIALTCQLQDVFMLAFKNFLIAPNYFVHHFHPVPCSHGPAMP